MEANGSGTSSEVHDSSTSSNFIEDDVLGEESHDTSLPGDNEFFLLKSTLKHILYEGWI